MRKQLKSSQLPIRRLSEGFSKRTLRNSQSSARAKTRNFPKVIYILGVRVKNDVK